MSPAASPTFEFTLYLSGVSQLTPEIEDSLFTAGCDDATLCLRSGRLSLTFARSAPTLQDAVQSAIQNVRSSGIDAWRREGM